MGEKCIGENLQTEKCFQKNCFKKESPLAANLHVKGNLNGKNIDKHIDVSIENLNSERQIYTSMNDLLEQKKWFPYTPFLMSPLSWNTAYETDNAENGYSLTNGHFFSQSDVKFASGKNF